VTARPLSQAVADLWQERRFTLFAGPCMAESYALCLTTALHLKALCARLNVGFVFKASFDKANRTAISSRRGPGLEDGLKLLAAIKQAAQVPIITDIHDPHQAEAVAQVADVLQIPALLCRQTDLIVAAAATGRPVNVKKGQFLAPDDMRFVAQKFQAAGGQHLALTERGTTFGYHNLVVDMRSLVTLRQLEAGPVIFDATHSVQSPGGPSGQSGGNRLLAPPLARAAAAAGIDALFCEVHPDPDKALSDGPNSLTLPMMDALLADVVAIRAALTPSA
jgi:2-dehydro-3-deoxyphosphooctonate aldolase (KDO 8-P synthase)